MPVRIVLHIGPMKTGTENLSARFIGAKLPANLIVPGGTEWPQARADVLKHPEVQLLGTPAGAVWEQRLSSIVERAEKNGEKDSTILLIAEAVNFVKDPAPILDALKWIADSVEVVFFARDQRAALPSWLAQRVQSWTQPGFTDLNLAGLLKPKQRSYKYDEIMARWSVDGVQVIPVPFFENDRGTDALAERFAAATGIAVPPAKGGATSNESLGEAQLLALGELKQRFAWTRRIPGFAQFAGWLFNIKRASFRVNPGKRWQPTPAERSQIADFYAESNTNFRKALGKAANEPGWKTWFDSLKLT